MRVALVYNPTAGVEEHAEEDIVRRLEAAGHTVRSASSKDAALDRLAGEPADVVIAAGGDGTVRRAAVAFTGRHTPLTILPLGTANNIARTLGLARAAEEIVRTLDSPAFRLLDLGTAAGPWGRELFIEGLGVGLFAEYLARLETEKRRRPLRLLRSMAKKFAAVPVGLWLDGADATGEYFLVEVLNIRSIGPFAGFAPEADPGDGELDVLLLGENEREAFRRYVEALAEGRPAFHPFRAIRCRKVEFAWTGQPLHRDDAPWPPKAGECLHGKITIGIERAAYRVMRPMG